MIRVKIYQASIDKTHTEKFDIVLRNCLDGHRGKAHFYTKPYIQEVYAIPGLDMILKVILESIQ